MAHVARIAAICREDIDERNLRVRVLDEVRRVVPFDAFVWLLTDPETTVGSSPVADLGPGGASGVDLPTLIRLKYSSTINRWTALSTGTPVTLVDAVGGTGAQDAWAGLLAAHGITDVVSSVLRDAHGCWGFLDLWRVGGTCTPVERALIGEVIHMVTPALRWSMLRSFERNSPPAEEDDNTERGSVLLLVTDELRPIAQTAEADRYLRALLPTDAARAPIPAAAFNVGAQLLASERGVDDHPARARVHLHDGMWVTLRAARIGEPSAVRASRWADRPRIRTAPSPRHRPRHPSDLAGDVRVRAHRAGSPQVDLRQDRSQHEAPRRGARYRPDLTSGEEPAQSGRPGRRPKSARTRSHPAQNA